jgi:hypothetical protein
VDFAPSQEVADKFPEIPREAFSQAVQLVRGDGSVTSGARAVFETLGRERLYESSVVVAGLADRAYRFVAHRRSLFYWLTRLTFGTRIEPTQFELTQWVFLRVLALIYAIAFASLAGQVLGLIGSKGISPAAGFLGRLAGNFGPMRFVAFPSLFWWNSSDAVLRGGAFLGIGLAGVLFFGYAQRVMLALLYVLYLSYSFAGQEFLTFQWDSLLLEAGFLAIFFGRSELGLRTVGWLYRWLVFRLFFLSGYVKLGSHDPTWANWTALKFHYHTQPLPTVLAWYADKLPGWFQGWSVGAVLAIELGAPFLIFFPRRIRMAGALAMLGLQGLIFLTGNYTYFGLLTAGLVLFWFDDRALGWVRRLGGGLRARGRPGACPTKPATTPVRAPKLARIGYAVLTAVVLILGVARILETTGSDPEPLRSVAAMVAPYQIVNSYGLFAVMTTSRPEIIVEGSRDGDTWEAYEFKYKPGDLRRAPGWVQPFQPRLDWQMWFAALSDYRSNPWFLGFALKLLEGSPEVLGLMEKDPFAGHPPKYVRAVTYEYSFTSGETRARTGEWWQRKALGVYLPPIGLRESARMR